MEPITIMLLAAWVTKMVTTHREDMEYARHGQDSPRYKMKMAQLAAAQRAGAAGGRPPARPGASGYMQELWRDSWEDLTEYRRRVRQQRKADAQKQRDQQAQEAEQAESLRDWSKRSLNTRPDGRPVDDMLDVAGVRPESAPHPHDPNNTRNCGTCGGTVVVDGKPCPSCLLRQQERNTEHERQNGEPEWLTPDPGEATDEPTTVVHDDPYVTYSRRNAGKWSWSCRRPTCPGKGFDYDTEELAKAAAARHRCRDTNALPGDGVQVSEHKDRDQDAADLTADEVLPKLLNGPAGVAGRPDCGRCLQLYRVVDGRMVCGCTDTPTDTQPLAQVIPLFPNAKEMTMANAEATGLPTAIAYAEAAASAHETFATAGSEGYTNALEGFEVSGEALSTAREAQEASTVAAEKWKAHHEQLVAQMQGREFYQSNPDAGNKQFLAGE